MNGTFQLKSVKMECLKMVTVKHNGIAHKVPCSKCAFCLQNKRSQWMFRIHHEMRTQELPGFFITLTYDEKHVPRIPDANYPKVWRLSLKFRHVQLFIKKVRKLKYKIKYICVGEYGGETKRPHYHLILWTDCPMDTLEKIWQKGSIHFGKLTMASAMYTLKYIIQPKQKEEHGIEKTRAQFSKGLGLGYLTTAAYFYHSPHEDEIYPPVFTSKIEGKTVALPKYYKDKIFTKYQRAQEAQRIKKQRDEDKEKHLKKLETQGVENPALYYQKLRIEAARRIIEKTKFNQSL